MTGIDSKDKGEQYFLWHILKKQSYHLRFLSRILKTPKDNDDVYDELFNQKLDEFKDKITELVGGFIYYNDEKEEFFFKKNNCMKKIMLVFGTRPEAIKMCPLVKEFQKYPDDFKTVVCVTGQHREMLDQVLRIFEVQPDYDLNIMKQGQDLYDITARVLTGMRDVLNEVKPDVVLVHGDTTTSTAAALAAFYQQIPVGHVEAGLRTHNIYSPWPEEMNRQITGRISTYNFSPTPLSEKNLKEEGAFGQIFVTGNTVIDALHMVVGKLKSDSRLAAEQTSVLKSAGYDVTRLNGGKHI